MKRPLQQRIVQVASDIVAERPVVIRIADNRVDLLNAHGAEIATLFSTGNSRLDFIATFRQLLIEMERCTGEQWEQRPGGMAKGQAA